MSADPGGSVGPDPERWQAIRRRSQALRQRSQDAIGQARAARERAHRSQLERKVLQESAYARLLAWQQAATVIEQAKGIIMAQQRCGPEEAFDLLCRAAQRANVEVRDLAAQMVEHFTCDGSRGNVTPITLGAQTSGQQSRHSDPPEDADPAHPGPRVGVSSPSSI